jgi:multidrug efflux system outer membrane protein
MISKTICLILAPASLLVFSGCMLGPEFKSPSLGGAPTWKQGQAVPAAKLPDHWWRLFRDPELNRLVDRALLSNNDLAAAQARVKTARALVGLDRARLFPRLDLSGSAGISRASADAVKENLPPGVPLELQGERYRSTFDLSYEPDLWGRNQRQLQASSAEADASLALYDSQRLGVATEVARQYFLLRGLDRQLGVLRETVASRQETLGIQASRTEAGLIDGISASRARTEVELAKNDLAAVERQRGSAEHALAVLTGVAPVRFNVAESGKSGVVPAIRAGLPADVLARRPDVRAAEQTLRAASARIGVAEAAFYPNFTLTAGAGFESVDVSRFLSWENRVLSLGTNLTAPIFNAGSNRANYQASLSRYEESLAAYRQTLLVALREVEDALVDLKGLAASRRALEAALASAQETRTLAQERFDRGLTNYLEVVDTDRTVLQTRLALSQLEAQQQITVAALAMALGGGW